MNEIGNEGDVRIVKCDSNNFAVEQCRLVEVSTTVDGKRTKTGATELRWVECGYYGHRLDHAAESALFVAHRVGDVVTKETVKDAISRIVGVVREAVS